MVEYPYAFDKSKNTLVKATIAEKQQDYYCPNCDSKMILKRGQLKDAHFSHEKNSNCSEETYLHKIAKQMLCVMLNKHKIGPFLTVCGSHKYKFNPYAKSAELEKGCCSNFTADVLAFNPNNEPVYWEIAVTHPCEIEKINSGYNILEIKIEEIADIEKLKNNKLSDLETIYYNHELEKELNEQARKKEEERIKKTVEENRIIDEQIRLHDEKVAQSEEKRKAFYKPYPTYIKPFTILKDYSDNYLNDFKKSNIISIHYEANMLFIQIKKFSKTEELKKEITQSITEYLLKKGQTVKNIHFEEMKYDFRKIK